MLIALYHYRQTFRSRWRAYAAVALLMGVLGGISIAAVSGARRTASAVHRFIESTNPSDVSLDAGAYNAETAAAVASFEGVTGESSYVAFTAAIIDEQGEFADFEGVGSVDGRFFTQDRMAIVTGRLPAVGRPDEVAVNQVAADFYGFRVGDRLTIVIVTDEQLADPEFGQGDFEPAATLEATVVGVGVFNDEVIQDDIDRLARVLMTPAFTKPHLDISSYAWQGVQVADPDRDVPSVVAAYAALPANEFVATNIAADDERAAQRAVRPLAVALGAFGLVATLVTLLLVGQAIVRLLANERDDNTKLRALGASPSARFLATALTALGPTVVGAVLAFVIALLVSPLAPIGPLARVEPDGGLHIDGTAMAGGLGGFVLVLTVVAGVAGWRELGLADGRRALRARRSATTELAARAGLPAPAVAGVRMALEPGQGRSSVPVRAAAFGAVLAVMAVVAALTFRSSLDTLASRPALYGWTWDLTLIDDGGYGAFDLDRVSPVLDDDPAVQQWSGMSFGETTVDGQAAGVLGIDPRGGLAPPVLTGRQLADRDEVVLGAALLDDLGKKVGDEVEVMTDSGLQRRRVVGTAALPTLGRIYSVHPSLGEDIVMAEQDIVGVGAAAEIGPSGPSAPALLVQLRPGTTDETVDRITAALAGFGSYEGSVEGSTDVFEPAELVNRRDLGTTPAVLAGGLLAAALASLGLTLATSVRRRRMQFGLLRVFGFTRRQLASTVAWQASVTVAIGLVLGIPLGVAAGQQLWALFAGELHVVEQPTVPVLLVGAGALGTLMLANLMASLPGLAASRTRAAAALREE